MSEEEDKEEEDKPEEKFEFTPEGESLGYLSLAQASLLAIQSATQIPGQYGPRYSGVAMVFEVAATSEDEDFYVITLSVRPRDSFLSRPGREQFFVTKEGGVERRQVLDLPRTISIGLLAGVGVAVVGVVAIIGVVLTVGSGDDGAGPIAASTPTEVPAATPVPTPGPQATQAPAVTQRAVNPGNVVLMLSSWGNERFDNIHTPGGGNNYLKFMHTDGVYGDKNGKLIPGIIDSWQIASDGLSWNFTVREGTKFHDGSDLTVDDVVWTYQHGWDKGCLESCTNIGNPNTASFIESTEKTGPNSFTISMDLIDSGFVFQQMSELGPDVEGIHPKRDVLYDTDLERAYDKNPIMAGQMSFVKHVVSEKISLRRFDDYFYQPANGFPEDRRMQFETLDILLVPEEATRAAAIQAGSADVAILSLQTRGQVEDGGGRLIFGEQGVYWWVFFPHQYVDPASTPFSNKNIRKALSYAFDKELLMDRLYGGSEVAVAKGWGAVTPNTIGYSPDLDPLPFDPDKARQILADEGYPNGEGFGKVIINTWVSRVLPFLPESALVAADFWEKELNLDVTVNVGDETSLKRAWVAGDLQGQILWRDGEARIDAAGIIRAVYAGRTASLRFHQDDALFDRVAIGIGDFNPETREKSLNDLYKILWDEHLELAIGYVNIPWAVGPRIDNWEPWPLAFFPSAPWTLTLR